ncbi:hypothetical protein [Xanthomonas melonis]|nr:hypothetical protein [Xanthomonas melonis]
MRVMRSVGMSVLLGVTAAGCSQPNESAAGHHLPAGGRTIAVSEQAQASTGEATEVNCPPRGYADVSSLGQRQLDPLYEIAKFALDGDLSREEFGSNPRYIEIALFGAEFLSTTDRAIRGIVDATSTPPISVASGAKLALKLASLEKNGRYARTGAMGALQAKIKTCLLMVKNDLR